jgi:nucleoside-diphosphate-sugar epimerase
MKRVLITGAEGLIGSVLRERLPDEYELRALTWRPVEGLASHVGDIADLEAIRPAFAGIDAVVQLAGHATMDATWEQALHSNIIGVRNVFEAAASAGVERVVFASSNHAVGRFENDGMPGIYRPGQRDYPIVDHRVPWRPDSLYGVSKSFGEAIGRYYAEVHGLTVLCLRIGSVTPSDNPAAPITASTAFWLDLSDEEKRWRQAATWLSHRDCAQLVDRCLAAELPRGHFDIFYGVSNNAGRFWDLGHAEEVVGYRPVDRGVPPE